MGAGADRLNECGRCDRLYDDTVGDGCPRCDNPAVAVGTRDTA